MKINHNAPMVITDKLKQAKEFYVKHFAFRATFDSDDHVCLRSSGEVEAEIMFAKPCKEAPAYEGKGLTWCLEVKDVDAEHERLTGAGLQVVRPLQDNPWGDRSFVVVDPAGIPLWIYKPIAPSAEFEAFIKD